MQDNANQSLPVGLMTVKDVALQLGCSTSMVYRIVAAGELAVFRIRRQIRVGHQDLADYLNRQRERGSPQPRAKRTHF